MTKKYYLDKRTFVNTKPLGGGLLQTSASPANTQLDLANFLDLQNYIEDVAAEVVAAQPTEFFADGTAAAPSITFTGDTDTGIYLGGNNILDFSVNGTKTLDVRIAQVTVTGNLLVSALGKFGDGAVATPALTFISNPDTGIYAVSGTQTGFTSNGTLVGGFNNSGLFTDVIAEQTSTVGVTVDGVLLKDGAVTSGGGAFTAGFYLSSNGPQSISGPGVISLTSHSTQITTTGPDAFTLANGNIQGLLKRITLVVDGGDATVTPATGYFGTATFNDVGDTALFIYNVVGGWQCIENSGVTIV
jgi:hypothetical protein